MTPLGLLLISLAGSLLVFLPGQGIVPVAALAFVALFVLLERWRDAASALTFTAILVAPLALYLLLVWGVVASDVRPQHTLLGNDGQSPLGYVSAISIRLFLIVLFVRAALFPPLNSAPLAFVRESRLPTNGKVVLMLTLSIASTMRASTEKAWASLVAANVLTPRMSMRNVRNMPVLALTVWMFTLSTLSSRILYKWKIEDIRTRLSQALHSREGRVLSWRDAVWLAAAGAAIIASLATGLT